MSKKVDTTTKGCKLNTCYTRNKLPFFAYVHAKSSDVERWVLVNPSRIEKTVKTLKINEDIKKRGL